MISYQTNFIANDYSLGKVINSIYELSVESNSQYESYRGNFFSLSDSSSSSSSSSS